MLGILTKAKDKALSELVRLLLNEFQFYRYGVIADLKANSEKNEIQCTLELKGEDRPLDVRATFQIVERRAGEKVLLLDTVWTSREWLNLLASEHLIREFPVSGRAFKILKALGM